MVKRTLKSGIMEDCHYEETEEGSGQGSVCSPVMANIYMYYVLVWWYEEKVKLEQVKATDKHTAESLTHFVLGKGDLVMADAGYGTSQNYIYAQGQNADVILRITQKTFCLYDMGGEKISLVHLLKDAEKKHMEWVDVFGFCRHKNRSGFVRVVAQRLPENQAEKAKKRREGDASRKQRHITAGQAFMSDCFLIGKQENTYSTYEKCKISFLQVTEILHLSCSVFIDLRDEKYNRYLLPGLPA